EVDDAFGLVHGVDVDDVRMVQLGRGLGLSQEACLDLAAKSQLWREHLDRDDALEPAILGAIDDSHAATPNLGIQLIVRAKNALDMRAQLGIRRRYYWLRQSSGSRIRA